MVERQAMAWSGVDQFSPIEASTGTIGAEIAVEPDTPPYTSDSLTFITVGAK